MVTFGFTVKPAASRMQSAAIVVGIADASVPLTPSGGGKAIGFHIGRSKVVESRNSHKLRSSSNKLSDDTPRVIPADLTGCVSVMLIVDTDTRRLAIAINDRTPIDSGYTLRERVRPWVWFGGPGVGKVTLAEYYISAQPPSSRGISAALRDRTQASPSDNEQASAPTAVDVSDVLPPLPEDNAVVTTPSTDAAARTPVTRLSVEVCKANNDDAKTESEG